MLNDFNLIAAFVVLFFLISTQIAYFSLASRYKAIVDINELILISLLLSGVFATYVSIINLFIIDTFLYFSLFITIVYFKKLKSFFIFYKKNINDLFKYISYNPFAIIVLVAYLVLISTLIIVSAIPNETNDIWVFQLPIANNIIKNNGFKYPLIDHIFYGSMPSYVNVLFAEALMVSNHFSSASMVNIIIFSLSLTFFLKFVNSNKLFFFTIILIFIGYNKTFNGIAYLPLTDLSRSIFSLFAILLAIIYHENKKYSSLILSGIFIGLAISTKYTELLNLIIVLIIISYSDIKNIKKNIATLIIIILAISSFWYIKNLILLQNPIYPFLFGHPGLTDTWMQEYLNEMQNAFDPALRIYSHNLLTVDGWRDYLYATWKIFFNGNYLSCIALIFLVVGLIHNYKKYIVYFTVTFSLFLVWYILMFNSSRWALTALLMLYSSCAFSIFDLYIILYRKFYPHFSIFNAYRLKYRYYILGLLTAMGAIVYYSAFNYIQTPGIFKDSYDLRKSGSIDSYLEIRPWYKIYRYIIDHDLRYVYHPFDNGVNQLIPVYNNGVNKSWVYGIYETPEEVIDPLFYISERKICYFIDRPDEGLSDLQIERLGHKRLKNSYLILAELKKNYELVLSGNSGWNLYKSKLNCE